MMADLRELADRVERLEGPDREVDAEIAGTEKDTVQWHSDEETPCYTASLDAAMSLVPEGWTTFDYTQGPSGRPHRWDLCKIGAQDERYTHAESKAATPALALTAAALRAIAEQENTNAAS